MHERSVWAHNRHEGHLTGMDSTAASHCRGPKLLRPARSRSGQMSKSSFPIHWQPRPDEQQLRTLSFAEMFSMNNKKTSYRRGAYG